MLCIVAGPFTTLWFSGVEAENHLRALSPWRVSITSRMSAKRLCVKDNDRVGRWRSAQSHLVCGKSHGYIFGAKRCLQSLYSDRIAQVASMQLLAPPRGDFVSALQ